MREFFGSSGGGRYLQSYCLECSPGVMKRYREGNKEMIALKDAARAVLRSGVSYTVDDKRRLWDMQGRICLLCVQPISAHEVATAQVDHATPLSRGGLDEPKNVSLTHPRCNASKKNKTLDEHWEYMLASRQHVELMTKPRCRAIVAEARKLIAEEEGADASSVVEKGRSQVT